MDSKIKFYLPNFQNDNGLNLTIIKTLQEHPEYFYDNISIGAVYGTFNGAIWNGGRVFSGMNELEEIESIIKEYNSLNIPLRFTFTNCLIEKQHLLDNYCNLIMSKANNGMNEVIVNSPLLEDYLRKNYPNFKYILSTTSCLRDIKIINEQTKYYDMIVLDYNDNHNKTFLESIQDKNKIELLVNAYCNPNCKRRKEHYKILSEAQLTFSQEKGKFSCECMNYNFYDTILLKNFITQEELYNNFFEWGFSNFKIEGRTVHLANLIESYIYYLIKPQYKDKMRLQLLLYCWH